VPNHSEIVAFNPGTQHFCTYLVPGNDDEVMGTAWASGRIWFLETGRVNGTARLDGFDPTTISGCSRTANKAVALTTRVRRATQSPPSARPEEDQPVGAKQGSCHRV